MDLQENDGCIGTERQRTDSEDREGGQAHIYVASDILRHGIYIGRIDRVCCRNLHLHEGNQPDAWIRIIAICTLCILLFGIAATIFISRKLRNKKSNKNHNINV